MKSEDPDEAETDINDIFSSIACSEDELNRKAFEEGRLAGVRQGKIEGYHLGYHRGAEVGFEIGCIESFARVRLAQRSGTEDSREKIEKLLRKLIELCGEVPSSNDSNFDIERALSEIRATYKRVSAMLKLPVILPISSPATQF